MRNKRDRDRLRFLKKSKKGKLFSKSRRDRLGFKKSRKPKDKPRN